MRGLPTGSDKRSPPLTPTLSIAHEDGRGALMAREDGRGALMASGEGEQSDVARNTN